MEAELEQMQADQEQEKEQQHQERQRNSPSPPPVRFLLEGERGGVVFYILVCRRGQSTCAINRPPIPPVVTLVGDIE